MYYYVSKEDYPILVEWFSDERKKGLVLKYLLDIRSKLIPMKRTSAEVYQDTIYCRQKFREKHRRLPRVVIEFVLSIPCFDHCTNGNYHYNLDKYFKSLNFLSHPQELNKICKKEKKLLSMLVSTLVPVTRVEKSKKHAGYKN